MTVLEKAERIREAARNSAKTDEGREQIDEVHFHTSGYAEPGYTDPESGVIATGNWNTITRWQGGEHETVDTAPQRLSELLERIGVELEWSDEWEACMECSKLFRVQPDSYGWKRAYYEDDENGDRTCEECVKKDPSEYLQWLEGNDAHCCTLDIDLTEHGYVLLEGDFENGFHHGQDANPKKIAKALRKQGVERFIFNLDGTGQFDIAFSVYVHQDEITNINLDEWKKADKDGPSPSKNLEKALRTVGDIPSPDVITDSQGNPVKPIVHHRIDTETGDVKTRELTPEEFVKGIRDE